MIILNTISLALDTFDVSEKMEEVLGVFNYIFTWLFTAEMIFKLIGLGPKQYIKDYYNVFDCCIVILSLIDFILSISIPKENIGSATDVLKAFRALRLMRMIKLARRWTALQEILAKMVMSLEGIGVFTILLLLFMYIFSLLGMQIFANYSYVDAEGNAVLKEELYERF